MNLFILCFVVIGLSTQGLTQYIDSYYGQIEESCSRAGGRCILKSECSQLSDQTGLCPNQQAQGFECCHGPPKSEYRCKKFGGECFKKPNCKRPYLKATDCSDDADCCILI